MASNALKKITTRAKAIRRAHPSTTWKSAVKKAGAEYRSGKKISGVKRKPAKKAAKRTVTVRRKTSTVVKRSVGKVVSVTGAIAAAKSAIAEDIGRLEVSKFKTRLKRDKNKIAKKIAVKKALYRKLS